MMTRGQSVSAWSTNSVASRKGGFVMISFGAHRRPHLFKKVTFEVQGEIVVKNVGCDHHVAGTAQRAHDRATAGSWFPNVVR